VAVIAAVEFWIKRCESEEKKLGETRGREKLGNWIV